MSERIAQTDDLHLFEFMALKWGVELRGFEPRTSCMPCNADPFTTDRCRSPQTPLTSRNVRRSPPGFTTVHCGR
jgi:hypothetical protein